MSTAAARKTTPTRSLEEKKQIASDWFRTLRNDICAEFEKIETEYDPSKVGLRSPKGESRAAGVSVSEGGASPPSNNKFQRTPWQRPEGGGGEISIMKGRVFEKVGVNISTVMGEFSEQFRKEIPGAAEYQRFWASGISLVAHMSSPLVPAAHFNTRMITTGEGTRLWFGGGGDLNPMFENAEDTAYFHGEFKKACDVTDKNFYPAFKGWCDEYFYIAHRGEARGVGGIFYDYLGLNSLGSATGTIAPGQFGKGGVGKELTQKGMELAGNASLDWEGAFAFTQAVGRAFLTGYPTLIRKHMHEPWTNEQREHQLIKRGRYAEYNLLYDRGTRFGLMTGGNPEAILMSLPPVAKWV